MNWSRRSAIATRKLAQQADELARQLRCTREQLEKKKRHVIGLEIALNVRGETITDLHGKIEQLREQNRRLDQEAERLADMVRFAPPADATMAAPK